MVTSRRLIAMMAALVLPLFFLPTPVSAACYVEGASGRLGNYCALDKIKGARIDVRTAQLIDYKLKVEGKRTGLGFPSSVKPNSTSKSFYPILSYSDNINGGNSPEPLVLGELSFDGEEELFRKEGVLTGFGVGLSGRYIHDEGRYLTYSANASHAHSPKYGIGITTTSASACGVNHVKNWWYVDICANTSRVHKDITDETNSNLSLASSKVFESSDGVYSEASIGVNRYFAESYTQNQLTLEYDTIHSNGVVSALNITVGESVTNQLTTQFAVQGRVSRQLANKPLTLTASYSKADGGMLLGFERSEKTYSVSASYPIWRSLKATVGYRTTNSTINYFDVSTPTFGVQFSSIQF